MPAALLLTGDLVALAAPRRVDLACGSLGGIFMYFLISFSNRRAHRLTFGALGEPLALKNSPGLSPSGKRGLKQWAPLRGVAGMGGDDARG